MKPSLSPERFDRSVSLLCWAYDERELIEGFLRRAAELLRSTVAEFEIVVVDDASTDGTPAIVRGLQEEIPEIRLIVHERNLDVGLACRRAITEARMEFLFWQTVDWSYDIERLRHFLELLRTYDVVAGVRPAAGLTRRSDTVPKAVVSLLNYGLVRVMFGVPMGDFQNVCFYATSRIQSIDFEASSSFVNPEALLKSYWSGASIVEVPIPFVPRQAGTAKGTRVRALVRSVRDVFGWWWRWIVLGRRPQGRRGTIHRLAGRPEGRRP